MAKRRRDSWGSISYDQRTRTARIRYWAEGADGYRRRSRTLRNVSRKEAEQIRAALMVEHGEDAPCPTVGQVWERWVLPQYESKLQRGDFAKNSMLGYKATYHKYVSPRWGDVPCDEVRPLEVQQWVSGGMSLSQARMAMAVLSIILDMAVNYDLVPSNVAKSKRYVMPPKSSVSSRDKEVWTLDQLGELWRFVLDQPFEAAFILSAFGSCRVGESLAVTKSDVTDRSLPDVPMVAARIDKQVSNRNGAVERSTKTASSNRSVVIVGRAAERLLGLSERSECEYLSNDGVCHAITQKTLSRMWADAVPDDMRHPFRNLRNSWQTWMRWELRVPPYMIEPMMGHVTHGTTGQYYDRPQVDVFCEVMADAYRERRFDSTWTWLDRTNWDD
jgi:integrase